MLSHPSKARTAAAVVVYLVAGLGAVAWKFLRSGITEAGWFPAWMVSVMPNFLPAAFLPMLLFATQRVVRSTEYLRLVGAIWVALGVYEIAQLWMPKRTFDRADIAASTAGACLGCLLGWLVFFRWLGGSTPAPHFNKDENDKTTA